MNHEVVMQKLNIDVIAEAIQNIHRDIEKQKSKKREATIKRHIEKTNLQGAIFIAGDYLLVAKRIENDGQKARMKWLRPQKIIRVVSEWIYKCQELINERVSLFHSNRLKYYADTYLNVKQELSDTIDHNEIHYSMVSKLLELRYNRSKKQYEIQVKWKGFDHEEPTWKSIHALHEDIPEMLKNFLESHHEVARVKRATETILST